MLSSDRFAFPDTNLEEYHESQQRIMGHAVGLAGGNVLKMLQFLRGLDIDMDLITGTRPGQIS
jgi:hypothetical protein